MVLEKKNGIYRAYYMDSYEDNLPILEKMDQMEELANKLVN